jgi:glutamyl-tRNA(Gln) amidotransferase subunit E
LEEYKMALDYDALGLRVGFEIHQELDTHKLFCDCPSILREEEAPLKIKRRLRPTQSELGEVDRAALTEAIKGKGFRYQVYPENICLVELDEEPPHPVNQKALDIALEIALLFGANLVDEVHVMRKTVIDGSNTAGFQRTMLVATGGKLEIAKGTITIQTICLEEDAARKVGEDSEFIDYRLDRLGIPLVEIATGPDFTDPRTPAEAALKVGQLIRATGKVKRGIGTIRQDINVSIRDGARQEIKGVQELSLIPTIVEREVKRQLALLRIKEELVGRGAARVEGKAVNVGKVFSKTKCKAIANVLAKRGTVLAIKLPKFGGLVGKELQPGRRFGTELADYAKVYGKVGGIFHTDELPGYGISVEEVSKMRNMLSATADDAIAIVAVKKGNAEKALDAVIARANQALLGVPEETRRALLDGNTEFMRPLPGAARMYVETDIPPIVVDEKKLDCIRKMLPELPEQKVKRYIDEYKLNKELAERMSLSENSKLFEDLVEKHVIDPTLIATTLEETLVSLRREARPLVAQTALTWENVRYEDLDEIFNLIERAEVAKEAIPDILREVAKGSSVPDVVQRLSLKKITEAELAKMVSDIIQENWVLIEKRGRDAMQPLMGILMEKVRGRIDGRLVHQLLERELQKFEFRTETS